MKHTNKSILHFIFRSLIIPLPVIVVFLIWYVIADPFKVLYHYTDYLPDPVENKVRIGANKGMVSFTNLNDLRASGHECNAFIFGSSISCYYNADEWADILRKTQQSADSVINPYHIDSSSESIQSMARKVNYLDRNGYRLRYALIVVDPIIMGSETNDGPPFLDPPQLHDNIFETINWHYTFFRASTNADFFRSWWPAKRTGEPIEYGHHRIFNLQPIVHNRLTNQETLPEWDSIISASPEKFYAQRTLLPSPPESEVSSPVLNAARQAAFTKIAEIFKRQGTSYQIIIGPNRAKVTLNPEDLKVLQTIFDPKRVHDFSSSMVDLLTVDTLLYDNRHYRPAAARLFMQKVYQER